MFSAMEAVELVGESYSTVHYWACQGIATATIPAKGRGSERRYSFEDVVVLYAMSELSHWLDVETRKSIEPALRKAALRRLVVRCRVSPLVEVSVNLGEIREQLRHKTVKGKAAMQ